MVALTWLDHHLAFPKFPRSCLSGQASSAAVRMFSSSAHLLLGDTLQPRVCGFVWRAANGSGNQREDMIRRLGAGKDRVEEAAKAKAGEWRRALRASRSLRAAAFLATAVACCAIPPYWTLPGSSRRPPIVALKKTSLSQRTCCRTRCMLAA